MIAGALDEPRGRAFPTRECVLVAVVTGDLHLGIHQLLYAVGRVEREPDVGLESRHDPAQRRCAVDPVSRLRKRLCDQPAEGITPDVDALRGADLLGEECMNLIASSHAILDRPAVAGVRRTGQRVATLQERFAKALFTRVPAGDRRRGRDHRTEVGWEGLSRPIAVRVDQERAVPRGGHDDFVRRPVDFARAGDRVTSRERHGGGLVTCLGHRHGCRAAGEEERGSGRDGEGETAHAGSVPRGGPTSGANGQRTPR